jgi:hypothetical protein
MAKVKTTQRERAARASTTTTEAVPRRTTVTRARVDEGAQRRLYGGFNLGSAFFGWLVATGLGAILTALLAAAGSAVALSKINNAQDAVKSADTVGIVSGILLILALVIAYFAGGYVAGRMSRFDGARQGAGVWIIGLIITILLAALGAAAGAKYNVLQQLNLPRIPVNEGSLTSGGIITLVVLLILTLLSAISGGKVGEGYHRKIDRAGGV